VSICSLGATIHGFITHPAITKSGNRQPHNMHASWCPYNVQSSMPTLCRIPSRLYIRNPTTIVASDKKIAFEISTRCPIYSGFTKFGVTPEGGGIAPTIACRTTLRATWDIAASYANKCTRRLRKAGPYQESSITSLARTRPEPTYVGKLAIRGILSTSGTGKF
jgi:hypothetical protein